MLKSYCETWSTVKYKCASPFGDEKLSSSERQGKSLRGGGMQAKPGELK